MRLLLAIIAAIPFVAGLLAGAEDRMDWTPGKVKRASPANVAVPTYGDWRARAIAQNLPLVIFVRVEPFTVSGTLGYATQDFMGIREGIVVSVPYQGDLFHRGMLPWDADAEDIRAEIQSLGKHLEGRKQGAKRDLQNWINVHSHRCARCGHSWTHEDFNVGIRAPHMCPKCGSGPNWPKTWSGQQTREIPLKTSFVARRAAYCPT